MHARGLLLNPASRDWLFRAQP